MNIQKIVLGICLCFVTPGYAQLGVIAQTKRIQVVPQPVAQVDRPGTFILTPATPWQVENDEQAEVVKRFGQQLAAEEAGLKWKIICTEIAGKLPASTPTMASADRRRKAPIATASISSRSFWSDARRYAAVKPGYLPHSGAKAPRSCLRRA